MASESWVEIYALLRFSIIPRRIPPRKRTGNRADAAENSRHECFDTRHGTGGGLQCGIGRAQQRTCNCCQCGTDGKSQGDGGIDVDTHQLGSATVLRDRQHGVTGRSIVHEPDQNDHDHNTDHNGDNGLRRNRQLTTKQAERLQERNAGDYRK